MYFPSDEEALRRLDNLCRALNKPFESPIYLEDLEDLEDQDDNQEEEED